MKIKFDINKKNIILLSTATSLIVGSCVGYSALNKYLEDKAFKEEQARILEMEREIQAKEEARIERIKNNKVAYLTFDDGPHKERTERILDILDKNNIKATFFMLGQEVEKYPEIVKKIYDKGHTIANHSTNHKYNYPTKESYIEDIKTTDKLISEAIGTEYKSLYVRVPGGSFGKQHVKEAIAEDGRIDLNWTALNGDSENKTKDSKDAMMNRLKETFGDDKYEVVLMHDIKELTVESLQEIIDYIKSEGYIFEPLVSDSPVI